MKKNPVKSALAAGKPVVGTWLSLGSVFAARIKSLQTEGIWDDGRLASSFWRRDFAIYRIT